MQSARFMGWRGDSLWLTDASLARVTVFPLPTGRVRTEPVLPPSVRGFQSLLPVGYGASAAVYLGVNQDGDSRVTGVRNDVALFLSRPSRRDTVAVLSRTNTRLQVPVLVNGQPASLFADQPFALLPHRDVGPGISSSSNAAGMGTEPTASAAVVSFGLRGIETPIRCHEMPRTQNF